MFKKRKSRSHYKIINGNFIEKKCYATEMDALTTARFINCQPNTIHKMVAYKCDKCGKWHIGSNNTVITEEIREKNRKKLKETKYFIKN